MRVLITGANGFIGRALTTRLLELGNLRGRDIATLSVLDTALQGLPEDNRLQKYSGDIADPALVRRVLADGVDVVFHLVSIPGGTAERDYDLGYRINLQATLELLHQLRKQKRAPVLVYASSVAVYGEDLPIKMNESANAAPALSYGAHKRMIEIALQDLSRRKEIDGRAVRLPGIVARPRQPNGLRSAFMSDLLHAVAAGEPYECPVSPQATSWWMSAACCVNNLLRAAEIDLASTESNRIWQLPVLRLSIAQVVHALGEQFGDQCETLVTYNVDADLEALFGRQPPLRTPHSKSLGLKHDGSPSALIRSALELRVKRPPAKRDTTAMTLHRALGGRVI
ncbi:NAD-dependent epimerase/dehydratase family protein [Pseudomonas sp. PB101]|uniref:NAD-dependent epimerase/dehydratase family protein n=1 Tax=Pseudomonas sp. PB101 TaxID=2495428 RepID=UPI0013653901|nr:NAD-dependent epimerase/dehydratase family protein [Pseudomonas sp. PB101]MVW84802.1 NAD-dependent epimerase/dehydratase family protein [Pseudomonas sp. PB101]